VTKALHIIPKEFKRWYFYAVLNVCSLSSDHLLVLWPILAPIPTDNILLIHPILKTRTADEPNIILFIIIKMTEYNRI